MNINLTKLITNLSNELKIEEEIKLDNEYIKNTDIKDIGKIKVSGSIYPYEDNYMVSLNIKCKLILICSISLKDVEYNIDIDIDEVIGENSEYIEENNKIINNTIDLIPIIWQNIILEVPLKVISPDIKKENIEGDGWRFITDEGRVEKSLDPRLKKLQEFLDE